MSARAPSLIVLARRSWIVAVAVVVSLGAALLLSARQAPRYTATTTWVVTPATSIQDPSDVLRSLDTLERRTIVATFARLPGTSTVRADVAERLALDRGGLRAYSLRGSVVPYTNLIRFEAEGPDAEIAVSAADGLARQIRNEAISLYRIYTLREVEPAYASRTHPDTGRNLVVGSLIGLFVGIGLIAVPLLLPEARQAEREATSDTAAA